jgi:serine/threonine protein kinase
VIQKLIGERLGHYRILRPIEQGGMASVFLARDIHLQREVAIKVFLPQKDQERTSAFFRRFTREAQIVARLDHPNILQVYDYGEQDGLAYLVMPYLAEGSLKHLLKARGRLPLSEALQIISQLLEALQYAHDQGLIHRDIKPGNILFKNNHVPVLADFGLVKEIATSEVPGIDNGPTAGRLPTLSSSLVMGTPYYMAPEQIRGRVQPASDIYSIGIVLYEMLAGQHPYASEMKGEALNIFLKHLLEPPRPIQDVNPALPPQLAQVVMRALEKDVVRRYQRPADFLQAIRAVAQQLSLNVLPAPGRMGAQAVPVVSSYEATTAPVPQIGSSEYDKAASTVVGGGEETQPIMKSLSAPRSAKTPPAHMLQYNTVLTEHARRDVGQLRRKMWSKLLYSVLAAIVLTPLVFAGVAYFAVPSFASKLRSMIVHSSPTKNSVPTSISLKRTATMPPTQTSCPLPGQARAAVMASYPSQGRKTFVYSTYTQDNDTGKVRGTLMRYDIATGKASPIATVLSRIEGEQLSSDGQWVIFLSQVPWNNNFISAIQMVRIDGQGLQTLYCASEATGLITDLLVSPGVNTTHWHLFFSESEDNGLVVVTTLVMLNIKKGDLVSQSIDGQSYRSMRWLNDEDIYLLDEGDPHQSSTGTKYSLINLTINPTSPTTFSLSDVGTPIAVSSGSPFDISSDLKTIFISQYKGHYNPSGGGGGASGPSTVSRVQQTSGGGWSNAVSVFKSDTLAVVDVRAITSSVLLLKVGNQGQYSDQNGIWKINTDGTGLLRLTTKETDVITFSASQDGTMYMFETGDRQAVGNETLFIGSTSGGQPIPIARAGVGGLDQSAILKGVGWAF